MRKRHGKPTRTRYLVLATCALGVLGAGAAGIASAQTSAPKPGQHRTHFVNRQVPLLGVATTQASHRRPTHRPRPTATTVRPPAPSTAPPSSPAPSVTPTTVAPTTVAPTTEAPTTVPTAPPTSRPVTSAPVPTGTAGSTVIDQVLAHINAARAANGVAALTVSAELTRAAEAHNALMAGSCGMQHQCPGEAGLGARFTAAGVSWNAAGENIGQGFASTDPADIVKAANGLTDMMMAEVPPNDGHRKNLLNTNFKRIGLAVVRDDRGRVWVTQDFVN